MKRRTLLATVGSATLAGTAGCYGVAALINRGDDGDQQEGETNTSENATGDAQTNENNQTNDDTNESPTDQERNESAESNETESSDGEASEENSSDGESGRPKDPVDTITVTDHGLDISESPDPDVDREIHCWCTFEAGEHSLRDVRIDAVALADDGTRLDHGWIPFAKVGAGESYDVDIPFYVNPDEIEEYLIGATEAEYAEE